MNWVLFPLFLPCFFFVLFYCVESDAHLDYPPNNPIKVKELQEQERNDLFLWRDVQELSLDDQQVVETCGDGRLDEIFHKL